MKGQRINSINASCATKLGESGGCKIQICVKKQEGHGERENYRCLAHILQEHTMYCLKCTIQQMSQLCRPGDNHWWPRNPNCATKKAGCHGGGYQGIPFNVPHVCRPREKQLAAANWSQKSKTTADEFNRIDSSAHTLQESAMYRKKYSSSLTYHVLW